jgi:hypothetical protein
MTDQALLARFILGPLSADTLTFSEMQACVRLENQGVLVRIANEPAVWIRRKA